MFSFFKRNKSKDSGSTDRNDKDKTKSTSGSSFFNKKGENKKRDSDNYNPKGGPSTSETCVVNLNGFCPEKTELKNNFNIDNKIVSDAISICDNNLNKSKGQLGNNKMGNVENKVTQQCKETDTSGNTNKQENVGETVTSTELTTSNNPPTTTTNLVGESISNPVQKLRADFFTCELNKKLVDNNKNDVKKSSSDFSGVSERATTTEPQTDSSVICQQPRQKEGTPDSDVVFKTAPNTPVLSRLPAGATNISELPSITEDNNNISKVSDVDTEKKSYSQQLTENVVKGNCDNIKSLEDKKQNTEVNINVSKILTESVKKINDTILNSDKATSIVVQNQIEESSASEFKNNEIVAELGENSENISTTEMAESAECSIETNTDCNVHKDVIPFAESDIDDDDVSQETSKSETTLSNSVNHDKSSSYSEKVNQNYKNDISLEEANSTENNTNNELIDTTDISDHQGKNKLEKNIFESGNENDNRNDFLHLQENNLKNTDRSRSRESSKETEDEATDSEMEDKDEIKTQEDDANGNHREVLEDQDENLKQNEITHNETVENEKADDSKKMNVHLENGNESVDNSSQNNFNIEEAVTTKEVSPNQGITEEEEEEEDEEDEEESEEPDEDEERQQDDDNNSKTPEVNGVNTSDQQQSSDFENKENLVNIESKADRQIRELKTEIKQSEKEINNLKIQVGDLQREVTVKGSGMERLQAELTAAYKESECVRKKLKRLEEDLDTFKQKNSDLTDDLNRKTENESENDYWRIIEMENEVKEQAQRIKDLEGQITTLRLERDKLAKALQEMTTEREEERKIVQEALDEALAEKMAVQEKYEREFEKLRSVNCDREQKMLDDFEWKLREVESACKKRLDDKEQSSKQLIREIEGKLTVAEGKLAQLPHLKHCEQELNQLREKSLEQTRALRTATRQTEQLQNTEKLLQDEVKHLKSLLEKEKSHLTTVQSIHNREIQEKDRKLQFRLEHQKNELNSEWEEKLKRDSQKIKTELERIFRNEKQLALEETKQQHENKLRQLKSTWEKKHEDSAKEIEQLKEKFSEKEEEFRTELETAQTASDRDIFELRRKLDKIDISYQEKLEKMQDKHEKEIERITEEADRKLQQCELNWQAQVGSSRTTIELVKEQMHREAQEQLQELSERHRKQLEEQWDQLIQERDETIALMEQKHRASMEKLRVELDSIYKSRNSRETESSISQDDYENNAFDYAWNYVWNRLMETLNHLRQELSGKTNAIEDLKSNVDELHENLEVLSTEVNDKSDELSKAKQTTDEKIRQREQQLEELHQGQVMELNERHQKEITLWRNNVEELQKKAAELTNKTTENRPNDSMKKIEELQKLLKEKDQQVANLSKEKHLYQLELMNKDSVQAQARQRKKGGRGGGGGSSNASGLARGSGGGATPRSNRGGRADHHNSRQSHGNKGSTSQQH